jgi:hypothetical protein
MKVKSNLASGLAVSSPPEEIGAYWS